MYSDANRSGRGDIIILRLTIIKSTCSPVRALFPFLKTSCYRGLELSRHTKAPINCSMGSWAYYGPIRDNKSGLLSVILASLNFKHC